MLTIEERLYAKARQLGAFQLVVQTALAHLTGEDTLTSKATVIWALRMALEHYGSEDFYDRMRKPIVEAEFAPEEEQVS